MEINNLPITHAWFWIGAAIVFAIAFAINTIAIRRAERAAKEQSHD